MSLDTEDMFFIGLLTCPEVFVPLGIIFLICMGVWFFVVPVDYKIDVCMSQLSQIHREGKYTEGNGCLVTISPGKYQEIGAWRETNKGIVEE